MLGCLLEALPEILNGPADASELAALAERLAALLRLGEGGGTWKGWGSGLGEASRQLQSHGMIDFSCLADSRSPACLRGAHPEATAQAAPRIEAWAEWARWGKMRQDGQASELQRFCRFFGILTLVRLPKLHPRSSHCWTTCSSARQAHVLTVLSSRVQIAGASLLFASCSCFPRRRSKGFR